MRLVDANVLISAVNERDARHELSRRWLERSLSDRERLGFAWIALVAFLRVSTHPGLLERPLSVEDAAGQVERWLERKVAVLVSPGPMHASILLDLVRRVGVGGNLVNDAHLAALAIEHGATVVSYDHDFARFEGVRWQRPTPAG
jgi:toxin-antitoxin system PIN domain toxin